MEPTGNPTNSGQVDKGRLIRGVIYIVLSLGFLVIRLINHTMSPISGLVCGAAFLGGVFTIVKALPQGAPKA